MVRKNDDDESYKDDDDDVDSGSLTGFLSIHLLLIVQKSGVPHLKCKTHSPEM